VLTEGPREKVRPLTSPRCLGGDMTLDLVNSD
jgi:hypothetical protein